MSTIVKKYRLERELPRYAAGSIVYHEYEELPSQFNSGTYFTDGDWYTLDDDRKVMTPSYVGAIIDRAISDHNVEQDDWVTVLT